MVKFETALSEEKKFGLRVGQKRQKGKSYHNWQKKQGKKKSK